MSANIEDEVFASTAAGIGSSFVCVDFPNQSTQNASGPGIYTDSEGVQSVRFPPKTGDLGVNKTCTAPYDFTNTVQSIFFVTMYILDLTTGDVSNEDLEACLGSILLVFGEASTQTISLHVCTSSIYASEYDISYNVDQTIISNQPVDGYSGRTATLRNANDMLAVYRARFMEAASLSRALGPTTEYDWPGLLMGRVRDHSEVRSILELADNTWRWIFAIWFSLYRDNLLAARKEGDASFSSPTGTVTSRQLRIMPSIPAFVVSILLIFLYLIGFLIVVWRRRHRYAGPRMPKTIGSIMPWVIHSTMLEDFQGVHYVSSKDRDNALQQMGRRYGFGRFRARNGRVTLGIEYEELLLASGAHGDF